MLADEQRFTSSVYSTLEVITETAFNRDQCDHILQQSVASGQNNLVKAASNPLSLAVIWLLMIVWSKRGNINTAALVTIAQIGFLSHWDPYTLISLEAVAYS